MSYNKSEGTLANHEAKANISRGTSYTKPRTITLDNKYDGIPAIDVWTGYAVNVVSKNGDRKIVCGPQTVLLDYDQTLEVLTMSTGQPKSTNNTINTVYLRHENNKVSDLIDIETKDFVKAQIKVSYCVNFDKAKQDKWFNVENYVKFLCDRERSLIKKAAKGYTIEDFYQNYSTIVHDIATDAGKEKGEGAKRGMYFPENGMYVSDVEVLSIRVESGIEKMLLDHQHNMVRKTLELKDAERSIEIAEARAIADKKEQELRNQELLNKLALDEKEATKKLEIQAAVNRLKEAEQSATLQAKFDTQDLLNKIHAEEEARETAAHTADLARRKEAQAQEIEHAKQLAEIEKAKQEAYAKTIASVMSSISPDLIKALEVNGQMNFMSSLTENMSPIAIANNESVAETTDRLLRGMPIDASIKKALGHLDI
jgi:major vault protein